jgi:hypothetical protein
VTVPAADQVSLLQGTVRIRVFIQVNSLSEGTNAISHITDTCRHTITLTHLHWHTQSGGPAPEPYVRPGYRLRRPGSRKMPSHYPSLQLNLSPSFPPSLPPSQARHIDRDSCSITHAKANAHTGTHARVQTHLHTHARSFTHAFLSSCMSILHASFIHP